MVHKLSTASLSPTTWSQSVLYAWLWSKERGKKKKKTSKDFLGGSGSKESACNAGDTGLILGWEDPMEKWMATLSSILAWRIPWTEEPGGLQSTGSQRVRHDWATNTLYYVKMLSRYIQIRTTFFKVTTTTTTKGI